MIKDVKLNITVIPNSQITRVRSIDEDEIKISINQAPENNKANIELCKYLSKVLKIKKSDVTLIGGFTSKNKTLVVNIEEGIDIINLLRNEI